MYKVSYFTLAIMIDDKIGNIKQSDDICYTDMPLHLIDVELQKKLKKDKRYPVITNIKRIEGWILNYD